MNRRGVFIVSTIGIMLILSTLGIVAVSLLGSVSSLALDYMHGQQAFYIAEAGLQWYQQQLQNDISWADNVSPATMDFAGGRFSILVTNCAINSIDATSIGSLTGYENYSIQRSLAVHVARSSVLAAFDYAIYIGGQLDTTDTTNLVINGPQQTNATDFPTVDFSYYQGIATQVISGGYTFATGTYTGIWYVDGNVNIDSNVTLNGSIISTGNINMNNNSNITIIAPVPYPALICEGNFLFQNCENVTTNGLIYVGANVSGNLLSQRSRNISFQGAILVKGNFNLQGSDGITITYDPSIKDNPPAGFSGTGSATVINGSNWREVSS